MVSIAPNQFQIKGTVTAVRQDAALPNFVTATIRLAQVKHLQGPAAFLDSSAKEIEVSVMDTVASFFREGMHIECKIRKAPGHFFLLPDSFKNW